MAAKTKYPFIVAWCQYMGSAAYYAQHEIERAEKMGLPFDTIYVRDTAETSGRFCTITNPNAIGFFERSYPELAKLARDTAKHDPSYIIEADISMHDIFSLMEKRGGSFAQHLAAAWFAADSRNKGIIEESFGYLIGGFRDSVIVNMKLARGVKS